MQHAWRDNAGVYATAGKACEFFADIPGGKGEYRLAVFPTEYDRFGKRKRGAKWKMTVSHSYDAGLGGWCIEGIGRDTYYDRYETAKEAMLAAETALADYLADSQS